MFKNSTKLIIRLQRSEGCTSTQISAESKFQRVYGLISVIDFARLLSVAENHVNPRSASVNSVTKEINDTLERSPELFWIMSRGILIATTYCKPLERNRYQISLSDEEMEGIMDGGHNTFAIASFLLMKLFNEKNIKSWNDCKDAWANHESEIYQKLAENKEFNFLIPLEIIAPLNSDLLGVSPQRADESLEYYRENISAICSARNTNVQLKETSKSNQKGLYRYLKDEVIGAKVSVQWKAGENRKGVKVEDVISLACLPLHFLSKSGIIPDSPTISPISIYSQKSKCVSFFEKFMTMDVVSRKEGGKYELINETVQSALDLTLDILKFFDRLYIDFPKMYNKGDGKFGRLTNVENKESRPPFQTLPEERCSFKYPEGFIYPILCGVTELMVYDKNTGRITWAPQGNPSTFTAEDLKRNDVQAQYISLMKLVSCNPQEVGKKDAFYGEGRAMMSNILRERQALCSYQ